MTMLASSVKTIELLKSKYDECLLQHDQCRASRRPQFLPARLLEIKHSAVVVIRPDREVAQYATLSYCWGTTRTIQLTQETLERFTSQGITFDELPLTIRHACELCTGLGICYIWVDCLCILQDSVSDWAEASSFMDLTYNSSSLTIKASAGADSSYGLFRERSVWTQREAEIRFMNADAITGCCFVRGQTDSSLKGHADRRGWILQEDLLSRRLVTFTGHQLVWQCCTTHWNENGTVLQSSPNTDRLFPRPRLETSAMAVSRREEGLRTASPDLTLSKPWEEIVMDYCSRYLTFSDDKLPALSGLASWIQALLEPDMKAHYLAGIWRTHLPGSLLWYQSAVLPTYTTESRVPKAYRAPSWSWAAVNGQHLEWLDWRGQEMFANITDFATSSSDSDPFGRVTDGHLDVQAPVKRGSLIPDKFYIESFGFCDEFSDLQVIDCREGFTDTALGYTYFDSIEYAKG
nr:hypothetical protein CFP56_02921 [Quercus suber]